MHEQPFQSPNRPTQGCRTYVQRTRNDMGVPVEAKFAKNGRKHRLKSGFPAENGLERLCQLCSVGLRTSFSLLYTKLCTKLQTNHATRLLLSCGHLRSSQSQRARNKENGKNKKRKSMLCASCPMNCEHSIKVYI